MTVIIPGDLHRTGHGGNAVSDIEPSNDLAYWAWTIIANVSEGDWLQQTQEWQDAAKRWRDAFHASLDEPRSWK